MTDYPLVGAKFVLYRETADDNGTVIKNYYSDIDENGILIFETQDINEAIKLETDEYGVLEQDNLVAGKYLLKEVEAPVGYDVIEEAIELDIPSQGEYELENIYDNRTRINITVEKTWVGDSENDRPESINIQLSRSTGDNVLDESYTATATIKAEDNWTYTFENLPKCDKDGNEYLYTVTENEVPGYTTEVDGYNITNTLKTTERSVEKQWDDNDNQDGIRTEQIEVQLYADDAKYGNTVTLDASNNWGYTWRDLPQYNSGQEIKYTVKETSVPDGYEVSCSEDTFTITNSHTPVVTERTVTKQWEDDDNQDGSRPDSITVQLKGNGSNCGEEIILSEENSWSYTWSDLPKYANTEEITYSVVEVGTPPEYAFSYSETEGVFTITNSYTPKEVSKTVSKNWDDNNNQDGIRTAQIEVQLYADDEKYGNAVILDASNNWAYTWNNLPQYNAGQEIEYTVQETAVPGGYEVSCSEDTFTITNAHKPAETERTVTKKWDDNGDQDGTRPDSIKVQLYADGEKTGDAVTLDASNNWSYTWNNLPEYNSKKVIKYTVEEVEIPDGYEVSYSEDTFTITNTHTPGSKATSSTKTISNTKTTSNTKTASGTKTGDESNMMLWLLLIAASAAGILAIIFVKKRKRN